MTPSEIKASTMAKLSESRFASVILFGIAGIVLGMASLAPLEHFIASFAGLDPDVATLLSIKVAVIGALTLALFSVGWRVHRHYHPKRTRSALEWELRRLIAGSRNAGRLCVFYQPKLDLRSGRVTGAEALVRWNHPALGMVPPGRFIELAEETGLIGEITRAVLPDVVDQIAAWTGEGHEMKVAVNVSGRDLDDPSFQSRVETLLKARGLSPDRLTIELTETAALSDPDETRWTLSSLRNKGFGISMDDFGTGYSSLTALHGLPFGEVKIDRTFVGSMVDNQTSRTIVAAMVGLARGLGIKVVAEGIEDERTLELLRRLGVDEGQGYAIGRPMAADAFDHWLEERDSPVIVQAA